jgi:hypothetical protein
MYSSRDITAAFHSNMLEAELGHGFVTLVALHLLLTETDKKTGPRKGASQALRPHRRYP